MQTGRRIVITGVTKGLGRALAEELIGRGHRIVGCGRSLGPLAELRERHPTHDFDCVDVRDPGAVSEWVSKRAHQGTVPDLLINNAGVINATAPLWMLPIAEIAQVIQVNLMGSIHVIHAWLPALIESGRGIIVNMSSGWGRSTAAGEAPYCASKWGVEGMTGALAQDLPRGLAAVSLNPGVIDTEMLRTCWGEQAEAFPRPETWARQAASFVLAITAEQNGRSLSL